MITHRVAGAPLDFASLRSELAVPGDFASAVLDEADRAARSVELPDDDATDIPFVTIDPAGSKDLDQALHLARDGAGYLVSYAIADVASFVRPGGAVDEQAHRRGETLYFPDTRIPLHPPVLSEGAASLLPDQVRPAVLWRITLDEHGDVIGVDVRRARVRSRAQYDYHEVQRDLARGDAVDAVRLLPAVGALRRDVARAHHAISLDLPAQEVERCADGRWQLVLREPVLTEDDNAQLSLLTGTCAAALMLRLGYGILRTVPPPDEQAVAKLRRAARALGIEWDDGEQPGDVLAGLSRSNPRHVVLIEHATVLLRGAAYTAFDTEPPAVEAHAGIGAPYAHVTAPLRRLVDRYATEICLSAHAAAPVPQWVRQRLGELPATMQEADRLAHEVDRAVVDMTEAWLLHDRVGETFDVLVIDANEHSATVATDGPSDPAVRAKCEGTHLPVGQRITARLVEADVAERRVLFRAGGAAQL